MCAILFLLKFCILVNTSDSRRVIFSSCSLPNYCAFQRLVAWIVCPFSPLFLFVHETLISCKVFPRSYSSSSVCVSYVITCLHLGLCSSGFTSRNCFIFRPSSALLACHSQFDLIPHLSKLV